MKSAKTPTTTRLVGGAGTGKTTELLRLLEEHRGDPLAVGFISFTRAARREASERAAAAWGTEVGLLEQVGWFRTIHSVAHRCLDVKADELLTENKASNEWLAEALGCKATATGLTNQVAAQAVRAWQFARNSMTDLGRAVEVLQRSEYGFRNAETLLPYVVRYEQAKRLDSRCDFEDLLSRFAGVDQDPEREPGEVWPDCEAPPGVDIWIVDESQDNSPLLDKCCRRLASSSQESVIAGDPFQSISTYAGSDWRLMMGWDVAEEVVMKKSWRCPQNIIDAGERCLRDVDGYFDRGIAGIEGEAEIHRLPCLPRSFSGETMLIARTRFRAAEIEEHLKACGVPYRPLGSGVEASKKSTGLAALWKFEQDEPVLEFELQEALALLPVAFQGEKVLARGVKADWKAGKMRGRYDLSFASDLREISGTDFLPSAVRSGEWTKFISGAREWRQMVQSHGLESVLRPSVRVGTIHSAKGLEADNVVVYCPTSKFVYESARQTRQQADEERRIAYVAVTRARKKLGVVNQGRYNLETL